MKSFKQYISEASNFLKGWAHKSGKMHIWKGMDPYHVQFMVNNLSKFRVKESDVINLLKKRFASWDVPDKNKEVKNHLKDLKSGLTDVDHEIEMFAMKKGWCRVVLESFSSIGGTDLKTIHAVAKHLDKKYPKVFEPKNFRQVELQLFLPARGRGSNRKHKYIDNAYDWEQWLKKGGDPDRIGGGRTEIGATMAMFREAKEIVCGMCFKWANDWNIEHHKGGTHKVVHGVVTNIKGKTFPHAWIEDKGKVYDVHSGEKGIVSNRYYKLLDPQDIVKYTPTKATQTLVRTRHHGPWDKKFDKWPTT